MLFCFPRRFGLALDASFKVCRDHPKLPLNVWQEELSIRIAWPIDTVKDPEFGTTIRPDFSKNLTQHTRSYSAGSCFSGTPAHPSQRHLFDRYFCQHLPHQLRLSFNKALSAHLSKHGDFIQSEGLFWILWRYLDCLYWRRIATSYCQSARIGLTRMAASFHPYYPSIVHITAYVSFLLVLAFRCCSWLCTTGGRWLLKTAWWWLRNTAW